MLSLSGFSGEIPRLAPRLLPDSAAQVARNCKLIDGTITPLRHPAPYRKLAPGNVMFYKRGSTWFEWNKVVDVAPAPVADNRLYVTGDDLPKIVVDNTTIYPLAVRAPEDALVAAIAIEHATVALAYNLTSAALQTALTTIVGSGNVACTGGPFPGTPIKVTFQGALAGAVIPPLVLGANGLTGGTSPAPQIDHTTTGSALANDVQTVSMIGTPTGGTFTLIYGRPDPSTQETSVYAYTYVTAFDEESEPSPMSNEITRSPGQDVTLTGFVAPPPDRNYNRIRIYRSQTSVTGSTDLYFIREMYLPVPTPSWVDDVEGNPIQEPCPSVYYNPPPDNLSGIIALPNGMMAGFVGKKLYLSEPWLPHAWPEKYALTTNFDIVGLGAFGSSIAVMTSGQPYVVTGIQPDAMVMEQLEVNFPCVNKRGIVDLGYSVAYPSSDGLVTISSNGARLATRELIARDKWAKLSPETMIAAQYDGRYIASYSYSDPSGATDTGMALIDLTGETPFLSRVDLYMPYMFFEASSGRMYGLQGEIAVEWDALNQPFMSYTWRSKKFVMNGQTNFGVALVDGEALTFGYGDPSAITTINIDDGSLVVGVGTSGAFGDPIAPNATPFQATIYADGVAVRTFTEFNTIARLPSGFLARTWEIEIKGERAVTAVYVAHAPVELSPDGGMQ